MALRINAGGTPTIHLVGPGSVSTLSPEDQLRAEQLFEAFSEANSLKNITSLFQKLCECVKLRPNDYRTFYTRLKERMSFSWKWKNFQGKLDKRTSHKDYGKGTCCNGNKVLIIGAGPCGLRSAIEAALLGAKVVVLEKRDRFSRNNVLHLWPFVITDLRNLGAKKFYPKFCGGSVDHVSIRILQCILLKVSLLLGVEVHYNVSFSRYLEPPEDQSIERIGWRVEVQPANHAISNYDFDVLIGADGRRATIQGFQRKVFRARLAIAVTANFINRGTPEEQNVPELSGVARIYNQQFFRGLHDATGIDLENIVYYKDATHYFVMTAKKASLLAKGVLINDFAEAERLLDRSNIDRNTLAHYALEAAHFSTNNQMPNLEFAINQHGDPDVHVFDFTNMYAAENSCRIVERRGYRLLINLVGDSLVEPFWPRGTGCAHGFLGVFDAAWMLRQWGLGQRTPLQLIAERETIYRSLSSISAEQLCKNLSNYTIDPQTRYLHIDFSGAMVFRFRHLFDTDSKEVDKSELPVTKRILPVGSTPKRMRRETVSEDVLLEWCREQLDNYGLHLASVDHFWKDCRPLCALIHRFRPELIDYDSLNSELEEKNWLAALKIAEEQLGVSLTFSPVNFVQTPENVSSEALTSVIGQLYDIFRRDKPGEFKADLSMDSSSLDLLLQGSRRKSAEQSRKAPLSPHSSKRTSIKEGGKDQSKRRRPFNRDALTYKRRESLENAGAVINMGEKIRFLEDAFNPDRGRQEGPPSKPPGQKKSYPLTEKLYRMETKMEEQSRAYNNQAEDIQKADPATVERLLEDYRSHGRNGLESKYGPELIRQVLFEDKKRDLIDKLAGQRDNEKYAEFDYKLKKLDTQLRDGGALQAGTMKVSSLADDYTTVLQIDRQGTSPPAKSNEVPLWTPELASKTDQTCFFCHKRVYLAERKSVEGLFFHRVCFRCHYCDKLLQVNGDYAYDRYDPSGGKFYCKGHIQFKKHDMGLLISPEKETSPRIMTKKSPSISKEIFTFSRYPSRTDLPNSPVPSINSPRRIEDDEEDNYSDHSVMDDEEVLRHNFGDSFNSFSGKVGGSQPADDSTSTSDEDSEEPVEIRNVIGKNDWSEAEVDVENWKKAREKRTSASSTASSSGESGEPMRNAYDDSADSELVRNVYEDTTSPSSLSDQECDREVLAVTSPPKANLTPSFSATPAIKASAATTVPKKVSKIPHSPYPDFSESDHDEAEEEQMPREEVVSVNGKAVHVRQTAGGHSFFTVLPSPTKQSAMPPSVSKEEDVWKDDERVKVVPAMDFSASRNINRLVVAPSVTHESSSGSDSYYTPPSALSDRRPKSTEIKWNTDVLESARRLRGMRLSEDSTGPESLSTPPVADDVFFTPKTSFPIGRPRNLIIHNPNEVSQKLDFDQSADETEATTPSTPSSSRDEVKMRWLSVAQEQKAAARARAKLKSDEELGIASPGLVRRTRKNSGSSGSEECRPVKMGQLMGSSAGSQSTGWASPAPCSIEQNVDDGRTVVTVGDVSPVIGRLHTVRVASASRDVLSSPVDNAENYFHKKAAQIAEKYQKQETTKLIHRAQEIQRLIDETEAHLEDLNAQALTVETALKRDSYSSNDEERLRDDWLMTSQERHKVRLQLEELKLMAENVQLEERHRVAQEQLRRLLAIEDDRKSASQKKEESGFLDEIVTVRRLKDQVAGKLLRCQAQKLDK